MKTIKVDVKQTILDIREGTHIYYEAKYDPANLMVRTQGEIPDTITVHEHAYEIKKVFTAAKGLKKEERIYAVHVDDRGLFNDLIQISNDLFEEKIATARQDGFWEGDSKGYSRGKKEAVKSTKELSLWKRLTNRF